jgi:hypothetical protein
MSMIGRSSLTLTSRARHRLRTRVAEHPAIYLPFARRKYPGPSPEVVGAETQLVIDGFTRSATTFAVYAFQLAQPRPVRLAHHLHAPAQLIAAARLAIPALVLIREPEGAVLSQLIREPWVPLAGALHAYARFYERLLPYRGRFVVGDFKDVTGDFGAVTRRLNQRFGTHFAEFAHTDANVRACRQLIRLRGTLSPTLLGFESGTVGRAELHAAVARLEDAERHDDAEAWVPSARREHAKSRFHAEWASPTRARLRHRAEAVYHAFREDGR